MKPAVGTRTKRRRAVSRLNPRDQRAGVCTGLFGSHVRRHPPKGADPRETDRPLRVLFYLISFNICSAFLFVASSVDCATTVCSAF